MLLELFAMRLVVTNLLVENDTIAAIATALGESSIGVVRVSGHQVENLIQRVLRTPSGRHITLTKSRTVYYGSIFDPIEQTIIDECVLLWMPGPRSYTAEDVAEFQVHGGLQMVQTVLDVILSQGVRLADPGEFTKRAFLNGRLDLSQAESVIDLIRSKTDMARRAALNQVRGGFSEDIRRVRKSLLNLQALVEVTIDYPEHDVEAHALTEVIRRGNAILKEIQEFLAGVKVGQILREGLATAIVGRPNVGKSSLMNALLKRDRAIVTDIPGTTRDVIEEYVNIRGIPLRLMDTAGIRETEDVVERMGVEMSRERLRDAELVLLVLDGSRPLSDEDLVLLGATSELPTILILNKSDLQRDASIDDLCAERNDVAKVSVSAMHRQGLTELEERVHDFVFGSNGEGQDVTYATNSRQTQLLRAALGDIEGAVEAAQAGSTLDLVAVELQAAYAELGQVIGEDVGEDLLDEIFSNFCLGK